MGVGEVHRLGPLLGDAVGGDDEVKPPLVELDEEAVKGLGDPLGLQAQLLGDGVAQVHLKAGELVLLVKVVEGWEGPFGADADLPALLDLVKGPHLGEGEAEGQDAEKHQDFTHGPPPEKARGDYTRKAGLAGPREWASSWPERSASARWPQAQRTQFTRPVTGCLRAKRTP